MSSMTGQEYDALPTLDKGAEDGPRRNQDAPIILAAPLTAGGHPNSNMPGRRKEDDENLVTAFHPTQEPISSNGFTHAMGTSIRRLTPTECERLQALPDGWTNPTGDARDSRRYAGLGDAVTSSVAEWIGRRILASSG